MRGLRTQESSSFEAFFAVVQAAAAARGCVFFFDTGEGRDFESETMEGEDLWGWLVPKERADEFEMLWRKWSIPDEWYAYFHLAVWEGTDTPTITFKKWRGQTQV